MNGLTAAAGRSIRPQDSRAWRAWVPYNSIPFPAPFFCNGDCCHAFPAPFGLGRR
jgi:hypothetical protein